MTGNFQKWKKIIIFLVLFCLLLIAGSLPFYSLRSMGYQFVSIGQKDRMIKKEKDNSLDALFFGDSQCLTAFAPVKLFGEYGITSYNCGTEGEWIGDTYILMQKALEKQNPSMIVLETSALYSKPSKIKYYLSQRLPIFHYHDFYQSPKKKIGDEAAKGSNMITRVIPYQGDDSKMSEEEPADEISSVNIDYLNKIYQLCQEKNIILMLATALSMIDWTNGKHKAVEEWSNANNVTYVDYNESDNLKQINFDWSFDTRDGGVHVNVFGAKKLTLDIGKRMLELYPFVDHRDDENYADWEYLYTKDDYYQ